MLNLIIFYKFPGGHELLGCVIAKHPGHRRIDLDHPAVHERLVNADIGMLEDRPVCAFATQRRPLDPRRKYS